MTGMTDFGNLHPRDTRSKRFVEKSNSNPEVGLDAAADGLFSNTRWELYDPNYLGDSRVPREAGSVEFDEAAPGGYSSIRRRPDGSVGFFSADGLLHRSAGAAHVGKNGELEYYLHGRKLTPPADGAHLTEVDPQGTAHWAVGSEGKETVTIWSDGVTEYRREGELHRDGLPALCAEGSEDLWFRYGVQMKSPMPGNPKLTNDGEFITSTGANFDENASLKETAGRLRYDVNYAARLGVIPSNAEAKVRYDTQAKTVRIEVTGLTREDLYAADGFDADSMFHTAEAERVRHQLNVIGNAYTQETREQGTDYARNNFDLNVVLIPTNPLR